MIQKGFHCHVSILILLTKSDKLPYSARIAQLKKVKHSVYQIFSQSIQVDVISSVSKLGVDKLRKVLDKLCRLHCRKLI